MRNIRCFLQPLPGLDSKCSRRGAPRARLCYSSGAVASRRECVPSDMKDMDIRKLECLEDLVPTEALQRQIWKVPDLEVIPATQMIAISSAGGITLGAYVDETMVGFAYGFPGMDAAALYLDSHLVGVLPAFQNRRIGYALKQEQFRCGREAGYSAIRWTFDPLQARNAFFNFHKLGVTARQYRENYYGVEASSFLRGLPSDRLLVEWDLSSDPRERTSYASSEIQPLVAMDRESQEPVLATSRLKRMDAAAVVSIEVPGRADFWSRCGGERVMEWRLGLRHAFGAAFAAGYTAVDFIAADGPGSCYYVLEKGKQWSHDADEPETRKIGWSRSQ